MGRQADTRLAGRAAGYPLLFASSLSSFALCQRLLRSRVCLLTAKVGQAGKHIVSCQQRNDKGEGKMYKDHVKRNSSTPQDISEGRWFIIVTRAGWGVPSAVRTTCSPWV